MGRRFGSPVETSSIAYNASLRRLAKEIVKCSIIVKDIDQVLQSLAIEVRVLLGVLGQQIDFAIGVIANLTVNVLAGIRVERHDGDGAFALLAFPADTDQIIEIIDLGRAELAQAEVPIGSVAGQTADQAGDL